jgi:hypothetical protein
VNREISVPLINLGQYTTTTVCPEIILIYDGCAKFFLAFSSVVRTNTPMMLCK